MKKLINNIFNKITNDKNKKYIIYLYCLINAIIFLSICSKCSWFYKFNNWDDANSFFTMGKGMANGLVIYKDLFEQKGPLLYLIHAIAYMISNNTFIGVFIFEVISFSIFLYFISKIVSLYCRKIHILWVAPFISFITLSGYVFIAGDSAEEFCFPLLAVTMYQMLNYFKNIYPNKLETKQVIITGITAGCVLCIKYNLLGFWFGFMAFLCIGLLINKKIKEAFLTGIYFFVGVLIVVIPWIIYFAINGALYDMFNTYFIVNISAYSTKLSMIDRVVRAFKDASMYAKNLWLCTNVTIIGYIYIMLSKNIIPKVFGKIALTFAIMVSILGVYYGANHIYYFLILMPFAVLGLIFFARLIEKCIKGKYINYMKFVTPIFLAIFIIATCRKSSNFDFHKVSKDDLVQYQFAKEINKKDDATILNYGFLDGGFYTVANVVPNIKYFHKPNISYEDYPIIMDEQNRYIREKVIDFVIIKVEKEENSKDIPNLYENYENIKSVYVPDVNSYYMLFKTK